MWAGPGLKGLRVPPGRGSHGRFPTDALWESSFPGNLSCLGWTRGGEAAEGGGAWGLLGWLKGPELSEGCGGQRGGPCNPPCPGWAAATGDLLRTPQLSQLPHLAASRNPVPHTPATETRSRGLPVPAFSLRAVRVPVVRLREESCAGQAAFDTAGGQRWSPRCRPLGPPHTCCCLATWPFCLCDRSPRASRFLGQRAI